MISHVSKAEHGGPASGPNFRIGGHSPRVLALPVGALAIWRQIEELESATTLNSYRNADYALVLPEAFMLVQ